MACAGKPLKRFVVAMPSHTALKRGVNETVKPDYKLAVVVTNRNERITK
jgi:hypothetical protein